jgi:hypothetical protein
VQSNYQISLICTFSWKICAAKNSQHLSRGKKRGCSGLSELGCISYLQLPKHQINHTATLKKHNINSATLFPALHLQ